MNTFHPELQGNHEQKQKRLEKLIKESSKKLKTIIEEKETKSKKKKKDNKYEDKTFLEDKLERLKKELKNHLAKKVKNMEDDDENAKSAKGRIPLNDQLKEINIFSDKQDTRRKYISIDVETSLRTRLTDSLGFRKSAKIVRSWQKILTPGSSWDFAIKHYLGNGIHINYLYDNALQNGDHPVGYTFCIEYLGDRNASLKEIETGNCFQGISPTEFMFSFEKELKYVTSDHDENDLSTYKTNDKDVNFEENSELEKIFHSSRDLPFAADLEYINLKNQSKAEVRYDLEYDNLTPSIDSSTILEELRTLFEDEGLEHSNLDLDDLNLNMKKSSSPSEYKSGDMPPAPLTDDDDEDEEIYLRG